MSSLLCFVGFAVKQSQGTGKESGELVWFVLFLSNYVVKFRFVWFRFVLFSFASVCSFVLFCVDSLRFVPLRFVLIRFVLLNSICC